MKRSEAIKKLIIFLDSTGHISGGSDSFTVAHLVMDFLEYEIEMSPTNIQIFRSSCIDALTGGGEKYRVVTQWEPEDSDGIHLHEWKPDFDPLDETGCGAV